VDTLHLVIETLVLDIAAGSGLGLLLRDWQQRRKVRELASQIRHARSDSAQWRSRYQETIDGLSKAIQTQFTEWGLSAAESAVALLILKGPSLGEIAALRDAIQDRLQFG
jgi:hypothetical protein